ncbi:hypothetical protein BCV70DRAFT_224140 [Testicularia cyperi]|uniref:Uncharacterized protein n=1 Tax=Testicularia cyperi TaxID=1882483 RepID=A0A317XMW6_9BASI|nr:hypothetical protein BCV70DRAFT_224140 [Testicularia cyperi]
MLVTKLSVFVAAAAACSASMTRTYVRRAAVSDIAVDDADYKSLCASGSTAHAICLTRGRGQPEDHKLTAGPIGSVIWSADRSHFAAKCPTGDAVIEVTLTDATGKVVLRISSTESGRSCGASITADYTSGSGMSGGVDNRIGKFGDFP